MIVTKLAFLNRFTVDETAAILSASDSTPAIRVYLFKLQVAADIDLCNPDTIAGVQQLETAGLIAANRAAEILAVKRVRILAPFNLQYPDIYPIINERGDIIQIEDGSEFDPMFYEVIA